MGVTFAQVKQMCRRENHEDNRKTMFFSSRVSIYITYLLARTNVSANTITLIFSLIGFVSSGFFYIARPWMPMVGFLLYRFHVVLDVVDGEIARFRSMCSPMGAYMDYITHYLVYSTMAFGCGVNDYFAMGSVSSLFYGFAISFGLVLNMASKDCWYRANFGRGVSLEARERLWKNRGLTLFFARICSVNSFLFLFSCAALAENYLLLPGIKRLILVCYAVLIPSFAVLRVLTTMKHGKIPRRAAWYR